MAVQAVLSLCTFVGVFRCFLRPSRGFRCERFVGVSGRCLGVMCGSTLAVDDDCGQMRLCAACAACAGS
jgi:hypothetical protein